MASWFKIIQEAKSILDREIPNWKREEEEYKLAKRRARGLTVPPTKARQDFLDRFNRWTYSVNIDEPDLKAGQARRKAKEAFFNNETGAPKYFNPQRTLQIYNIKEEPEKNGWMVHIDFGAEFKTVQGKRLNPSLDELSKMGFTLHQVEHEPLPERYILTLMIPHREGITQNNVIKLAGPQLKELQPKIRKFMPQVKMDLAKREFHKDDNVWEIGIKLEGKPTMDYIDVGSELDLTPIY